MHTLSTLKANSTFIDENYNDLLAFLAPLGITEDTDLSDRVLHEEEATDCLLDAWQDNESWPDSIPGEYEGRDSEDYYSWSVVLGIPDQLEAAETIHYNLGL